MRTQRVDSLIYLLVILFCGVGVVSFACGEKSDGNIADGPQDLDPAIHGLHMVRDPELRAVMKRLQSLDLDAISSEMDQTGVVPEELDELASIASSLADDASVLPLVMKDSAMSNESRGLMVTLSQRLKNQADELARAARTGNARLASTRLDAMMVTCVDCHREFRAPSLASR